MAAFIVATNARTTFVEVHKPGCAHTRMSLDSPFDWEGDSALAVAADFEHRNDGILVHLGPCVRDGAKQTTCPDCGKTTGTVKRGVTTTVDHRCEVV